VEIVQPRWSSWVFLVYAGGFVVLFASSAWLQYFDSKYGNAAYAGWALLVFACLLAVAVALRRAARWIPAGVFAFVAVLALAGLIGALWTWFGWLSFAGSSLHGFHLGRLLAELAWLVGAVVAVTLFRFPLIVAPVAGALWLLVVDFLSNGGSWTAAVSILVGLCFLGSALLLDLGSTRPYGFWLHVAAGLAIGGPVIYFWHGGSVEWALVALASVLYVWLAGLFGRSSWAVLGVVGLLIAAAHFSLEWTRVQLFFFDSGSSSVRAWVTPLVFTVTGFLIAALGLGLARRHRGPV
jgi:hypothetical protein